MNARDGDIRTNLTGRGITVESFNATLLFDPSAIRSKAGTPFKVFTPFWRTLSSGPEPERPLPAPATIPGAAENPRSDALSSFGLLPTRPDWAGGICESWIPGEAAAAERFFNFLEEIVQDYQTGRDRPDRDGTSRLSPYLRWGEISPRQIWHAAKMRADAGSEPAIEAFLREIGWREFTHGLLQTHPNLAAEPMDSRFTKLPWRQGPHGPEGMATRPDRLPHRRCRHAPALANRLDAQPRPDDHRLLPGQGSAGPLAGGRGVVLGHAGRCRCRQQQRQLAMDRRLRRRSLPLLPGLQSRAPGEKFDPDGAYVSRFVPELAKLPRKFIHHPWDAPADVLAKAGVRLGKTYPHPIVDHATARDRALDALRSMRQATRVAMERDDEVAPELAP
jgi:deoxyribodipyrimidine photo-lyase